MSDRDFYSLLGVSQQSSDDEIKKSYKKLARQYHPDNKDTGDEELFKKLGEAYSVLSDPQKRAYYDRVGHAAFQGGGASGSEIFTDLNDLFENFFGESFGFAGGGRGSRQRGQRGSDLQTVIELDFLEAAFGCNKTLKIPRLLTCKGCKGSGAAAEGGLKTCQACNGAGEIKHSTRSFLGMITQVMTCSSCSGSGQMIAKPCSECKGKKQLKEITELELKVPKGAEDGSRLAWQGKGNEGLNGGQSGDLYILLKVKPHPRLKRKGLDIFEEREISIWEAILGSSLEAETIHGSEKIEVKQGTQSGSVNVLHGMGIVLENSKAGSHHLKLNVKIPTKAELPKELLPLIEKSVEEHQSNPSKNNGLGAAFSKFFGKNKD